MIREFLNALTEEREDQTTCTECADLLWVYVHDESQGRSASELNSDVTLHIRLCPHCAQEYRELKALIMPAYTELLSEAESALEIDLSFLPSLEEETLPSFTEGIRHWIIQLGSLLDQATQPALPVALAGTRSQNQNETVLAHEEESQDFKIEITGQTSPRAPDLCTVEVRVQIPSLGGPLDFDGITVQLAQGATILFEDETDPTGRVIFEDVKQDDLASLTCIVMADQE